MSTDKDNLLSIQYLRALAALMVVLHHARDPMVWLFNPLEKYNAFAWGVDIFFVISGFIMYVAARNESHFDFLGRRIIRVVPLYWMATTVLLLVYTNLHFWGISSQSLSHFLQSILFIPHYDPTHPDQIWPYLIPGWTLNYEMLFYLIFFVGLMTRKTLIFSSITILSLFVIGAHFHPQSAILKAYTRPIIIEFLCGMLIGCAYVKGLLHAKLWVFLPIGIAGLFLLPFDMSLGFFGKIAFCSMIILGAASLGKWTPHNKLLKLLGDASYSIYLTHTIIPLYFLYKIWPNLPLEGWLQFTGWMISALLTSSIIGVLVYLYVEKPILNWLRNKWKRAATWRLSNSAVVINR